MRSSFILLSSVGAALAWPSFLPGAKRTPQECGPDSNCEIVEVDGRKSIRFREGMGPGSDDYKARFGTSEDEHVIKRQDDEYETTVTIGKTKIPWGCVSDQSSLSVKDWVGEALHELCLPHACDAGSDKTFDTQWADSGLDEAKLTITAEGEYEFPQEHSYIDAVLAAIHEDVLEWETKEYTFFGGVSASRKECEGVRAPNFIRITRRKNDGSLAGTIQYKAKLEIVDDTSGCAALGILQTISGAINGIAGGFFGIVNTICEA